MTFDVTDMTPKIGSHIKTDLDTLLGGAEASSIRNILEQRGVIFFRGLTIDDGQQVAIAKSMGKTVETEGEGGIYKISLDKGVNASAKYLQGSMNWHSDGSLQPCPNYAALLRAVKLSDEGGETEFSNTYAAYDELLDEDKALIKNLRVVHSAARSQFYVTPEMSYEELKHWHSYPSKSCPLVWRHQSGRKSLVLGATCDYIEDMSVEDSRELLARLRDWSTQPRFVYQHQWQEGDLLIWSNTGTMHRALPYDPDSGRLMLRTILAGEEPLN